MGCTESASESLFHAETQASWSGQLLAERRARPWASARPNSNDRTHMPASRTSATRPYMFRSIERRSSIRVSARSTISTRRALSKLPAYFNPGLPYLPLPLGGPKQPPKPPLAAARNRSSARLRPFPCTNPPYGKTEFVDSPRPTAAHLMHLRSACAVRVWRLLTRSWEVR